MIYKTAIDYAREKNHQEIVELLAKGPVQSISSPSTKNQQQSEEVSRLNQLVDSNQGKINELEHEYEMKQKKIDELELENEMKQLKIDELDGKLSEQSDREASLKEEVENLKKKIKSLEQQKVAPTDSFNILDSSVIKNLRIIREISSGGFGKVLEVGKEETYALKGMHVDDLSISGFKAFIGEYEKLTRLHHPNVVQAYGVFMSDATNPPSILLEFCPKDLQSAIKLESLSNVQLVIWIYQIVEGMRYVHKCQLVHRDIKPSNILVGKDGKIRISDFGIAKLMTTEEQSTTLGAGSQKFMAPEILKEEKYNEKADVYPFGVLIFFMLSRGEMPKINVVQMEIGKKAEIPSSFSHLAKDLINQCWNYDAKDRPSFDEILSLLEGNNFKLFEFNDQEISEIK